MLIQTIFSAFSKGFFALLFLGVLFSACGSDNKPGEQASTGMVDTTQIPAPSATLKLDFEHFGNYDLSTWTLRPPKTEEGGDIEIEVLVWEKDGMTIEVEEVNKGEYGLDIWYRLTGADGKVQKTRSLIFANDPFSITETVNDYTVSPAKKYTRTQVVDQHYSHMNPLRTAATGAWKEGTAVEL